jgi:glycosyltransferase involved in cell wall biosynthesis
MFQRQAVPGRRSIERVFSQVCDALPEDVEVTVHLLPFESRGVWNLLRNMVFARRHRGAVNHITGDVHYIALALPRRSTVLTVHDLVSLHRLTGLRRLLYLLLWYRLPLMWVREVTVISEWTRQELVRLHPGAARKITVVHNPASLSKHPAESTGDRERTVVLQVGTGSNKNLRRVVDALQGLPVHLRVIGHLTEQQLAQINAASIEFSSIFAIDDSAMEDEYARCDLVMFASTYEGFGLPIVEGNAAGRPVITSGVAAMQEVAGDAALIVDPTSVSEIRAAVLELRNNRALRDDLVCRGFANLKRFDARAVAGSYATIYRSLARSHRAERRPSRSQAA